MLGSAGVLALALGRATAVQLGVPDLVPAALSGGVLLVCAVAVPTVRSRLTSLPSPRNLALGAGLGVVLLLPGASMRAHNMPSPGAVMPDVYILLWIPLVALISVGEETALRGWLQPLAKKTLGSWLGIALIAAVFAAMHAPLHGMVALPLDFGVGLLVGCLREYSDSIAACSVAHFLADLGHLWLP